MAQRIVTSSELDSHKTREDLWVGVHGKVYNLTTFASDHPGGLEVLLDTAGTDATEPFDYVGHAEDALLTMQKFIVGHLEGSEEVNKTMKTNSSLRKTASAITSTKRDFGATTVVPIIAVVAIAGAALYIAKGSDYLAVSARPSALASTLQVVREFQPSYDLFGNATATAQIGVNKAGAFFGGLAFASSLSILLLAYLYTIFAKTLVHEKNVFSYPSVIPRTARTL